MLCQNTMYDILLHTRCIFIQVQFLQFIKDKLDIPFSGSFFLGWFIYYFYSKFFTCIFNTTSQGSFIPEDMFCPESRGFYTALSPVFCWLVSFFISVFSVFILVGGEVFISFCPKIYCFIVYNHCIFLILLFRFFQYCFHLYIKKNILI